MQADGEPYWLDSDRQWAKAWLFDERSKMACGCYPDETSGIDNDDRFTAHAKVCHRHRAIGEAAEARAKNATAADSQHGLLWMTTRDD